MKSSPSTTSRSPKAPADSSRAKSTVKSTVVLKSAPVSKSLWQTPTQYLKGVGEKLAKIFKKVGIENLWEMVLNLPRTYEDRRHYSTYQEIVASLGQNKFVMSRAKILNYTAKGNPYGGGRRWIEATAQLDDESRFPIHFVWFNDFGGSLQKRFPPESHVIFRGKVQQFQSQLQISHPDMLQSDAELPEWEKAFVPIYREVGGLSTRIIRKIMYLALEREEFQSYPESLPQELVARLQMPTFQKSLRELHFPRDWEPSEERLMPEGPYFKRIVFEELFMMALALHRRRAEWKEENLRIQSRIPKLRVDEVYLRQLKESLPYQLTSDQASVLQDVFADLSLSKEISPMHRLVQGDVGSGKTIVAFLSALVAMQSGFQVALMAPTEILANQHFENFKKLFPQHADKVFLLKGALTAKMKKEVREALESGRAQFVIGTQALLTETTQFKKLGLVIVDEQHRFGVEQRLTLKEQGDAFVPHLLVMTATPIPRSLALTLYGDLNISSIREKPVGRIPIETHLLREKQLPALVKRIEKFIAEGRQIYIVYPLIEESEELDLKNVKEAFLEWQTKIPSARVGLLHGKMKSLEKDQVMQSFKDASFNILVTTTVIEVGVDVPNASVIVIENAERFGLSQLHQLRGRVGRGSTKSYCVLIGKDAMGPEVQERLKVIETNEDGFKIAEKDLEIRGPGEFLGRRQSGLPGFRVAHILRDLNVMIEAREEARKILERDPQLKLPEHSNLKFMIQKWWAGKLDLTLSG